MIARLSGWVEALRWRFASVRVALFFGKWVGLALLIGLMAGLASTLFLWALDWATQWREAHPAVIALLPVAGLGIGLVYHTVGQSVRGAITRLLTKFIYPPISFRSVWCR